MEVATTSRRLWYWKDLGRNPIPVNTLPGMEDQKLTGTGTHYYETEQSAWRAYVTRRRRQITGLRNSLAEAETDLRQAEIKAGIKPLDLMVEGLYVDALYEEDPDDDDEEDV